MYIHEYQAKLLFQEYQIPVLSGFVLDHIEQFDKSINQLNCTKYAIKAQLHSGGRGKAGGVKICDNTESTKIAAANMLGSSLTTHQSGNSAQKIHKVYIESGCTDIAHEYYLSLILDRSNHCLVFIASAMGGMNIEEIAKTNPEQIIKVMVDLSNSLSAFHLRKICFGLNLPKEFHTQMHQTLQAIYQLFLEKDANQIEINPLVTTKSGKLLALDAKISFDDNALFKHQDISMMKDDSDLGDLEKRAAVFDLNYIKLDGTIGCMVNGAGLAMATMDLIHLYGQNAANFLDVGGAADHQKIKEAFHIIVSDSCVTSILVNIFGGIVKCDLIAEGIVNAVDSLELKKPIVVRLDGTNASEGREILKRSGLQIQIAQNLQDAIDKIIAVA